MPHPQVGARRVQGPLLLASFQRRTESAADNAHRGGHGQQHDQDSGHHGVPGYVPQGVHQPGWSHRTGQPRQYQREPWEYPHNHQADRHEPQHRTQQQGVIEFQLLAAHRLDQERAPALDLPPKQADQSQQQEIQIITVQEGRGRRASAGLPGFNYAVPGRCQRGKCEHQDRQSPTDKP